MVFVSSSKKNDIDGCSVEDHLVIRNAINRQLDLVNSAQNAGAVSDDLQDVVEQHFASDFTYTLKQGPAVLLYYGSRDSYLFGDDTIGTQGFVLDSQAFGKVNIWASTQYLVCHKNGNLETAIFVARGGDNIIGNKQEDGLQTNIVSIVRIEWSLEKQTGKQWQVKSLDVELNPVEPGTFFGTF